MKNLVKLSGKPLLHYSISASKKSKFISKTIVSTDSEKIAQYAKNNGVEVIKRPKRLATNAAKIEPVMDHVLKYLKQNKNYEPDVLLLLQNTSPLRTSNHIDEAIKLFVKNNYDSVLSVKPSHSFLWQIHNEKAIPINYNPKNRPNRQQIKNQFIENGAIYITKLGNFKKSHCRISGKIGIYEMPENKSVEIDSLLDLNITKQLLKI